MLLANLIRMATKGSNHIWLRIVLERESHVLCCPQSNWGIPLLKPGETYPGILSNRMNNLRENKPCARRRKALLAVTLNRYVAYYLSETYQSDVLGLLRGKAKSESTEKEDSEQIVTTVVQGVV